MISFTRYISITSGVGGTASVALRELIARVFTTNELLPTGTIREFDSADAVGDYFGTTSVEYKRARQYFRFISKVITKPKKIAFARWADAATAPMIFGASDDYLLASFTSISTGSINITLGPDSHDLTGLDFTSSLSLADVAAVIQTAVNGQSGTMWTSASVSYDATAKRFNLEGGSAGPAAVAVEDAGSGTPIMDLVGWGVDAIFSDGAAQQTISDLLGDSTSLNNNFGSFCFTDILDEDQVKEAAEWNATQNNMFQYHTPVLAANRSTTSALIIGLAGNGMTLDKENANEYPEMLPMSVLAATDYTKRGAAKNYMFQRDDALTATVTEDEDADIYDPLRINYMGLTQQAGQTIKFYQRGFLCGGDTVAQDMGVYANEQWLKDAIGADIMSLLLVLEQLPANSAGAGNVLAVIQTRIDQALFNGTIQPGKDFTTTQKLYIGLVTGDELAWHQVQSIGYWIDAIIEPYVDDEITQYKCSYTLVYAKGDSVRKVEGRDIMI